MQQLHKFRVSSTNYDTNFIENVINVFIFAVKHKCNLIFDFYKMAVKTYGIQKTGCQKYKVERLRVHNASTHYKTYFFGHISFEYICSKTY